MYETIKQYSETQYVRKEALMTQFGNTEFEVIWNEIKTYRALFRHLILIEKGSYEITLNPYVYRQILEVNDLLYQQRQLWIKDSKEVFYQLFLKQVTKDMKLLHVLSDDNLPLLLRIYLSLLEETHALYDAMLAIYQIRVFRHNQELCHFMEERDITYGFLRFLSRCRLLLEESMVSYTKMQETSIELLLKRYPTLQSHQVQFYVTHQDPSCYYTIADYQSQMQLCYESARQGMEGLVNGGFYRKRKVGKRFVYSL